MTTARQAVRDTLERVYGHATQTVLDDQAADEIMRTLHQMGYAPLDMVARIIEAAGGSVTLTAQSLNDPRPLEVETYDDPATLGKVFRARRLRQD